MAYELILQAEAILDIQQAFAWYEDQKPRLGDLFLDETEECFQKISQFPLLYSSISLGFRKIKVGRFPYLIVYEVADETIFITRIKHTSRAPIY